MDLDRILAEIRGHPRIKDAGMVLFHVGLVRSFSLKGFSVDRLEVRVDRERAEELRQELLQRPGMVDIRLRLFEGDLAVGDPIMVVAVAGDTRETVFPVLQELVERLKKECSQKREIPAA